MGKDNYIPLIMGTSLLVLGILLIIGVIKPIFSPKSIPVSRFETIIGTPNMALDTVTGQLCYAYDPIGVSDKIVPLCKDIQ